MSPTEWMYSVEARLNEEAELTVRTAEWLAAARKERKEEEAVPTRSGTGVERIDLGLDQLVSGCKLVDAGLKEAQMADLPPEIRKVFESMKEIMQTAVEPYLVDLIGLSDKLDGVEQS